VALRNRLLDDLEASEDSAARLQSLVATSNSKHRNRKSNNVR